jgi:PAS domain S-box-containing protein
MSTPPVDQQHFLQEVTSRFGLVPSFFSSSEEAPEMIERLWDFAKAAYLDNPIPSLFKERLFVYLSRFCEVRYCITRHCAFLLGFGHAAGDPLVHKQTLQEVVALLKMPPPWQLDVEEIFKPLEALAKPIAWPKPGTPAEYWLFLAATIIFVQPARSERARRGLRQAVGGKQFEYLMGLLTFIRAAHYWTILHPDLELEEDILDMLRCNDELTRLLLDDPEASRCDMGAKLFSELEALRELQERRELEQSNRELQRSAEENELLMKEPRWLASIVECSDDAIISKTLDGVITSWNKGAERVFGYKAEEVIGKPITILIPSDRQNEEPAILERIGRGERTDHYETIRQRKDGSLIAISLTVSPVRNAKGEIVGASKIARDITERKRSEELIATLAREAEHRAKNVLAAVQATVNLSQSKTPEGLKRAIEGRIQALATVHTLFAETHWKGATLSSLAQRELAPYLKDNEARAHIDGPQLLLEPNVAQAIAMTLHELATNAAKYGALSVAKGRVAVKWSLTANGRLIVTWTEKGGPKVKKPMRQGFGTRVMERMIRDQQGDLCLDWRAEGVACEISLPM